MGARRCSVLRCTALNGVKRACTAPGFVGVRAFSQVSGGAPSSLTRKRSLVQTQYRPPCISAGQRALFRVSGCPFSAKCQKLYPHAVRLTIGDATCTLSGPCDHPRTARDRRLRLEPINSRVKEWSRSQWIPRSQVAGRSAAISNKERGYRARASAMPTRRAAGPEPGWHPRRCGAVNCRPLGSRAARLHRGPTP